MRRSILTRHLLALEPREYAHLHDTAADLEFALVSAAIAAIPPAHPDQRAACRDWLDTLMPTDRDTGWLTRLAGLLLAARDRHAPVNAFLLEADRVRLLHAAYMLAVNIRTGARHVEGSALSIVQRHAITRRSTPRAALSDILTELQANDPTQTPPAYLRAALTTTRRRTTPAEPPPTTTAPPTPATPTARRREKTRG